MKRLRAFLSVLFIFTYTTALAPVGIPPNYVPPLVTAPTILTVYDIVLYADQLDFFDPKLIASIAKIESDYQPKAKSLHKGITYYGLMQISYDTARMVGFTGQPKDLMNWKVNVRYAAIYLEQLIGEHGSLPKAVAAYNAGTVYYCKKKCPKGQLVNQEYVDNVMKVYKELTADAS